MHFSPQQSGQDNVHAMHSKEGALLLLHRGIIHRPRKFLYQMLRRIVCNYFAKCALVAMLVKESKIHDNPSGNASGVKKRVKKRRRRNGESVKIKRVKKRRHNGESVKIKRVKKRRRRNGESVKIET
ncbi:hypothetical protein L2E82_31219 [Cichorium intybus]|uniref:Uncharacterized protein n=1 Tax=Cichorium intybus TaxID=13427 RepID=A0ACB9D2K9_CICIN|nr:hypothetical protein L2E82_31219 [Cichorium intybus]